MIANRIAIVSILFLAAPFAAAQEPAAVLKHDGWVAAVAFAPDGKTLASAGADNVVRLWEVGTWKPKGVLKGHTDCVTAVAFGPDSKWLVTGSFDHTVKIWNLEKLRNERTLSGHSGPVLAVIAFSDDEPRCLLSGGVDGTICSWSPMVKIHAPEFRHKSWVNSLARHGNVALASGSSDATVHLLKAQRHQVHEGGAGEVRCVAFNADGKLLAAGNRHGTVRIWDVNTRKEVKTITGHMGDVWSIAFSPDGKTLAAVDTDWKKPSKIKLYDTATWKERAALDTPGEILSIAYSPKGDWLAAGCWDKTVRVFAIK